MSVSSGTFSPSEMLQNVTKWRLQRVLMASCWPEGCWDEYYDMLSQMEGFNEAQWAEACTQTGVQFWYDTPFQGNTELCIEAKALMDTLISQFLEFQGSYYTKIRELEAKVEHLYELKAQLTENIYDIYDRLYYRIKKRSDAAQGPGKVVLVSLLALAEIAKQQVAQMLQVPTVSELHVDSWQGPGSARLSVHFGASHPVGIADFSYQVAEEGASSPDPGSWINVGARTELEHYFVEEDQRTGGEEKASTYTSQRTLFVRARGPAGYTNWRSADVTVTVGALQGAVPTAWEDVGTFEMEHDYTPPTVPVVVHGTGYVVVPDQISVSWSSEDQESGVVEYEYRVLQVEPSLSLVRDWRSAGGLDSVTIRGLELENDHRYKVVVRARNGEGLWSQAGYSQPIHVDLTPPMKPEWLDVTTWFFTGEPGTPTLRKGWRGSSDPESGIAEYRYALDREPITSWDPDKFVSVGLDTFLTHYGEPLAFLETFYVSVVAVNNYGLVSDVAVSGPVAPTDPSPPPAPDVDVPTFVTSSSFVPVYVVPSDDPETGIAGYKFAVGTSEGSDDVRPWGEGLDFVLPPGGGQKNLHFSPELGTGSPGFYLENGGSYWVGVRAVNGDGDGSEPTWAGFVLDFTPPKTPVVAVLSYQGSLLILRLSNLGDEETWLFCTKVAVGSSPGATDVLDWTPAYPSTGPYASLSGGTLGLEIAPSGTFDFSVQVDLQVGNTYYVQARSLNVAGLRSEVGTAEVYLEDHTPPEVSVEDEGEYTAVEDQLRFRVTAFDPETGIEKVEYAVGTVPGAWDVRRWTSTKKDAGWRTADGLHLEDGVTYFVTVKVKNGGNSYSTATTDGITVVGRPDPPEVLEFVQTSMHGLEATWSVPGPYNTIAGYEYAIGTKRGRTNVSAWTFTSEPRMKFACKLEVGRDYYLSLRTKDVFGRYSKVLRYPVPVTASYVDDTGPVITSLRSKIEGTGDRYVLRAYWSAVDEESGISGYEVEVREVMRGEVLVPRYTVQGKIQASWPKLELRPDGAYVVQVWATNGVGLVSTEVSHAVSIGPLGSYRGR